VIVVSIPDWGTTPFARDDARSPQRIAEELDVYNAVARDETSRAGARWVDITALSRSMPCWSPTTACIPPRRSTRFGWMRSRRSAAQALRGRG
jgi:hypothetical protein